MDGVSLGKSVLYGHLWQYETEYASPERGSQVEGRNRQGYQQRYQQGGPVYNIYYDRKPPHMIDNQLRQDTRINENRNRELKEKIIGEVEERITFLVQSLKTQQVQNMTPQYHQQDAVMQQYQQQPIKWSNRHSSKELKLKRIQKKYQKNNRRSKKLNNKLKSCKFY